MRLIAPVLNGNNASIVSNGNTDLLVVLITDSVPMDSVATQWVHASDKFVSVIASLLPPSKTPNTIVKLQMVTLQNTAPDHPLVVERLVTDSAAITAKTSSAGTTLTTTLAVPTVKSDLLECAKQ